MFTFLFGELPLLFFLPSHPHLDLGREEEGHPTGNQPTLISVETSRLLMGLPRNKFQPIRLEGVQSSALGFLRCLKTFDLIASYASVLNL